MFGVPEEENKTELPGEIVLAVATATSHHFLFAHKKRFQIVMK